MSVWFGNLTVYTKSELSQLVHTTVKVIGIKEYPSLQPIFEETVLRQIRKIISDLCLALPVSASSIWTMLQIQYKRIFIFPTF